MNKQVFTRDALLSFGLPYSDAVKSDQVVDVSRWSVLHELVFEWDGTFWMCNYTVGATEYQDESPWEYEDTITCTEVELKEIVVKRWVPV